MRRYEKYKDSDVEWIGEIPEHWELKKLKYLTEILTGSTPKSSEESYWNGSVNWVTTDDLGKLDGKEVLTSKRKISAEGYKNSGTYLAPINSIVLSTRAPIGHLGILKVEACTNQGCKTIAANHSYNSLFLYYFLHSVKRALNSLGTGTTFLELPTQSLKRFLIVYPNIKEQTTIANFLDRKTAEIDTLIESKKQLLELYEEERTAIINRAVTKGIDPDAPMKDSGIDWLGEIPEHWGILKLKNIARVQTGRTPKIQSSDIDYFENGQFNWFTPSDFKGNNELTGSNRKLISKAIEKGEAELFPEFSIYLVSIGATLGKVSYFKEKASANQQINIIVFDKGKYNPILGYYFLSGNKEMIRFEADFTTLPILNQSKTKNLLIAVPPLKEQVKIIDHIESERNRINEQVELTQKLIKLFSEYRESLINEVVTGKLKVVESETKT